MIKEIIEAIYIGLSTSIAFFFVAVPITLSVAATLVFLKWTLSLLGVAVS